MDQPPPIPDSPAPPSAAAEVPRTSLAARLMNVFATPGEVFEEVKASPKSATNWLAPAIVSSLVGIIAAYVMFSQPNIVQKLKEQQEAAFEAKFEKGQMTRQQVDATEAALEKFMSPTVLMILGSAGAAVVSFARVFGWAFVLWLLAKVFLKKDLDYMKTAEIAGLAGMVAVLGMIVSMLLTLNLGKMGATPSLALAVGDFDPQSKTHLLLGAVNVVNFWEMAVLGTGLSRLANVSFARGTLMVLGFWIIFALLTIGIGMGTMAL